MRSTIGTAALAALYLISAGASPQNPSQAIPSFRGGVDLVVLDVSVLDRQRMPVRGLTASDFTILEDGRRQDVSSFAAVDLPDTETTDVAAGWTREVAPDVQSNDEYVAPRGIFVIVMDDATPMPAVDVMQARSIARRVIDRLGPHDLAAVVFPFNQPAGQQFTHDRARLLSAIDRFNGSIDASPRNSGKAVPFDRFDATASTLYRATIATLRVVAEHLIKLPQRRKALVFVSVGVPFDPELDAPALMPDEAGSLVRQLARDLHETLRAAQRANVNIYGLDPGLLRAPVVVRSPPAGTSYLEGNPGRLNREFLGLVSQDTGGFAITNTNDMVPGIVQIFRENASYYLLGYNSSNPRAEGKFRRVEVTVNRPGVTVRARTGYYELRTSSTEPARAGSRPPTPLDAALAGPFPSADMSLRVTAAPFARSGIPRAAVVIVLGVRHASSNRFEAASEDNLEVALRAYDQKGRNVASDRLVGKVVLSPARSGEVAYEVLSCLDLEPGRYQLRVGVESSLQGKSGSVYCDLDVPDFSKPAVSLSGVAIGRVPGLSSASNDTLASLIPLVPTAEREFEPGDRVTAFLRVYQGGSREMAPVVLAVTVRDARSATVFQKTETLQRDRFSNGRSADFRLELPISNLKPGLHLLTVEATLGNRTSRRQVRFAIR